MLQKHWTAVSCVEWNTLCTRQDDAILAKCTDMEGVFLVFNTKKVICCITCAGANTTNLDSWVIFD